MEIHTPGASRLVVTGDGSHTLYNATLNQHYHSVQGSLQESMHIFIELGLRARLAGKRPSEDDAGRLQVFEMGFGTGLNALLTWKEADETGRRVTYRGIEAYPVEPEEARALNYEVFAGKQAFQRLHQTGWGEVHELSPNFMFFKEKVTLESCLFPGAILDLVYYDAFAPEAQPELWSEAVFHKIASGMKTGGFLVTYSSKGSVRRALQAAGFEVEKHPGPGRKREVIRAVKK